jgi:hypothetical protein
VLDALALIIDDGNAFVVAYNMGLDDAVGLAYTYRTITVNLVVAVARNRVPF